MTSFVQTQESELLALASKSDLFDIEPLDAQRFRATFRCKGLVRDESGDVREHDLFEVGIRLPDDYLRYVNPAAILTLLAPLSIWHPNIRPPLICAGPITPGTPMVELIHRCFEIISFQNVTMDEADALTPIACAWARQNRHRFPIDPRPIKRRTRGVSLEEMEVAS